MSFDVAVEIIRDEIVISLIDNAVAQGGKSTRVAESTTFDGVENFGEVAVELEVAVGVGVAEVFDVFSEVAEKEDVGFADFARDFNLGWNGQFYL